ncbi:MAG TPA: alpha/beta family hydrolase [Acidimicrobiales bacterium]|nr:alpha/beta family hydrolase [Acidimicrobiales bacterium]
MTTGVLLTPGASATRDHSQLVAIDQALAASGVAVERIDLPQSRPGPRVLQAITEGAASLKVDRLFLGGRSFGGRMCSVAVAEGLAAAGLVLVSYPLHPPGRPEQRRVEHFPALHVPCLFVSGTRDAFATPAELEEAAAAIPGAVTHVWIEGGGHGLRGKDGLVAEAVRSWILARAARGGG